MGDRIYGLLGRRLGHSYSTLLHSFYGTPSYALYEKEPEELASFLRRGDIGGLNVTIPYKSEVIPYLDGLSPEAKAVGAVNTVAVRDGRLVGHNTDIAGLRRMIERSGVSLSGRKVLVLGSGGASKAAGYCAAQMGARECVTVSRSGENHYGNISRHADADILINCTPVGMWPDTLQSPVDLTVFNKLSGVFDLIYNPARTRLVMDARERGIPAESGLWMLAAQALYSEELFFGRSLPEELIGAAVGEVLRSTLNIVLIGMPGSGKSAVGAALAAITGRELVDTDDMIVRAAGKSIPDIFAQDGEEGFRALEREAVARAGRAIGAIITTGGGVVKDRRNDAPLRQNGVIYEIQRSTDLLATDGRPLSEAGKLREMYERRRPMYEAFRDAAADNNGSVEETAARIWRDFCENTDRQRT